MGDRMFDTASYVLMQGPQTYLNIQTSLLAASGTTDASLSTQPVTQVTLPPHSAAIVYA